MHKSCSRQALLRVNNIPAPLNRMASTIPTSVPKISVSGFACLLLRKSSASLCFGPKFCAPESVFSGKLERTGSSIFCKHNVSRSVFACVCATAFGIEGARPGCACRPDEHDTAATQTYLIGVLAISLLLCSYKERAPDRSGPQRCERLQT